MDLGSPGVDLVLDKADSETPCGQGSVVCQSLGSSTSSLASVLTVSLHVANKMATGGPRFMSSQLGNPAARRCLTPKGHNSVLGKAIIGPAGNT